MTAQLKIDQDEATPLRAHYEGVARDTLRTLWRHRFLISATLVAALVLAVITILIIGPRYTGEAIIQLNFSREEPAAETKMQTKIQTVASVDPIALVDSTARVIRSRATMGAVVARLELDKDPEFAHESVLSRLLPGASPSPHDLAVKRLMRKVTVTNEPRSYLISIAITMSDPSQAARLANAVAVEFLRGQVLQQTIEARATAERELAQLSSIYGDRHPAYIRAVAKVEELRSRLIALRQGLPAEDAAKLVVGQSLVPAEEVLVPSGPNIIAIFGVAIVASLALGVWLALLLGANRSVPFVDKLSLSGKRTLDSVREYFQT